MFGYRREASAARPAPERRLAAQVLVMPALRADAPAAAAGRRVAQAAPPRH